MPRPTGLKKTADDIAYFWYRQFSSAFKSLGMFFVFTIFNVLIKISPIGMVLNIVDTQNWASQREFDRKVEQNKEVKKHVIEPPSLIKLPDQISNSTQGTNHIFQWGQEKSHFYIKKVGVDSDSNAVYLVSAFAINEAEDINYYHNFIYKSLN